MTFYYAPATDTREIPRVYIGNPPTTEMLIPLRPALPARPRRPLRPLLRLVSRADWRQSWDSALTVCGGLALAGLVLAVLHLGHDLGAALYTASLGGAA